MKYGSAHGELNSCLSHGNVPYLLEGMLIHSSIIVCTIIFQYFFEGTCGSGSELDCDGYSVVNDCCEGHLFSGWW